MRPIMPICHLFTRSSYVPAACLPSRCEAPLEQRSLIDQDPSFVDYDLISSSRVYIASLICSGKWPVFDEANV